MENATHEQKKNSLLKVLAILGLIGVIILLTWLSIRLVRVLPTAFSSLASLAETVNEPQTTPTVATLTVSSNTTLIAPQETVILTWNKIDAPGNYTFSFQCADGITIDLITPNKTRSIACDTNHPVGENTTLSFSVDSTKERYTDIFYTVSFFETGDSTPRASGNAQVTVVNGNTAITEDTVTPEFPNGESSTTTPTDEETVVVVPPQEPIPVSPTPPVVPEEEISRPVVVTPVVKEPVPTPVVKEPEPVFVIPTSDPNGRTDLGTKFVSIGKIVNTVFIAGPVKQDQGGAIRFEIMNYGTKTSSDWKYTVALPDDYLYTSPTQKALKPSERATITLSFPATTKSSHSFIVRVNEASDKAPLNDSFLQKATFVK